MPILGESYSASYIKNRRLGQKNRLYAVLRKKMKNPVFIGMMIERSRECQGMIVYEKRCSADKAIIVSDQLNVSWTDP